jgi:hypothetical protein
MFNNWNDRKRWATSIDLNEYAEANQLIVLYPQAAGDSYSGTGAPRARLPREHIRRHRRCCPLR